MSMWKTLKKVFGALKPRSPGKAGDSSAPQYYQLLTDGYSTSQVLVRAKTPEQIKNLLQACAQLDKHGHAELTPVFARIEETYPHLERMASMTPGSIEWLAEVAGAMEIATEAAERIQEETIKTNELLALVNSAEADVSPIEERFAKAMRSLPWSETPGALEANLKRRTLAPIFPMERRFISSVELDRAKKEDDEEFAKLNADMTQLQRFIAELSTTVAGDKINEIRIKIDSLLGLCATVGGKADKNRISLCQLRDSIMDATIKGLQNRPEAMQAILDIETAYKEHAKTAYAPALAQLYVIPAEDFAPNILCLEPTQIEHVLRAFSEQDRNNLATTAEGLVREMRDRGEDMPGIDDRLALISAIH